MSLVSLIVLIAVMGLVVWLILQIPMPASFKNAIVAVAVFGLVIFILQDAGLLHGSLVKIK